MTIGQTTVSATAPKSESPPGSPGSRVPGASAELPKSYAPADAEPAVRAKWEATKAFHADPNAAGEPFCIVIPPPNVTAALHLGHAFNNTLQDVLVRYHRMKGYKTLWMPGTDHAGIATQTVVDKRLQTQKQPALKDYKKLEDQGGNGREQFVAKVQSWKDEYEATIISQLKAIGCSCDFERTRFTMDEVCAKAVREAFFRLFKDGLIYRGKRLVNWDPVSQTALADDEVEMEEVQGHMYYLRYPLENAETQKRTNAETGGAGVSSLGDYVVVATTRPETMLGDTAVAMNPRDPRAAQYVGRSVRLPIVDRVVPIIADDYVVMPVQYGGDENDAKAKIATGFLKVTPAHDDNDYQIGQRHPEIGMINVFAPDASISDKHGWPAEQVSAEARPLIGLSREEARKKVVQWFKDHGLLEDVKPYTHSVGHSYRSHVPIEPYLSDQWYVKVTDDRMRGEALRAMVAEQREASITGRAGVPPAPESTTKSELFRGRGVTDELTIHQRSNLPHWQLGGSTYYITFCLDDRTQHLSSEERRIVLDSCLHWHGVRMHVYIVTVMPDHVHLIMTPLKRNDNVWWALPDLVQSLKGYTSHEIQHRRGTTGVFWQQDYFDRIIRSEKDFFEKWTYIVENPLRAGLVKRIEDYEFTAWPSEHAPGSEGVSPVPGGPDAKIRAGGTPALPGNGDHALRFFPARYAKTFQTWHENIRDWCISRQIWWGHRIPVWRGPLGETQFLHTYESDGDVAVLVTGDGAAEDDRFSATVEIFVCVRRPLPNLEHELSARGFVQDPDVLDTWFSSALWPISTMGWPDPSAFPDEFPEGEALLNTFNPSTVLFTAREILTLWVSRMVMFNRYFRDGKLPFEHVYVHAMIQDGHGQKMSKSLGNGVDPRDIVHTHGADALRFTMTQIATNTQDVRLPVDMICPQCSETFHPKEITTSAGYRVATPEPECPKCKAKMVSGFGAATGIATPTNEIPLARNSSSKFDEGRNFANKLWNATRFALSNLSGDRRTATGETPVPPMKEFALVDRWIISRLHRTLHVVEDTLADYQFKGYADAMYDFVWRDFCDWYLEAIKPTVKTSPVQQQVLRTVLNAIMRLLHPIMPFVTETLWPHVQATGPAGIEGIKLPPHDVLAQARWPDIRCSVDDAQAIADFERVQVLVNAIRQRRSEQKVHDKKLITLHVTPEAMQLIERSGPVVATLARLDRVELRPSQKLPTSVPLPFEGGELLLTNLVDAVDAEAERARLTKLIAEKQKAVDGFKGRLANPGYTSKAPPEKVEETRRMLAQAEADLAAATGALQSL